MRCSFRIVLLTISLYVVFFRSQAYTQSLLDWSGPVAQKHNLKGQVKRITQVQSPVTNKKADWLDGHSGQNYSEEYNKQGYLLKRISCDDYNEPQDATNYEYNSRGQVTAIWDEALSKQTWGRTEGRIEYEFNPIRKVYIVRDKRVIMSKPRNVRIETAVDSLNRVSIEREYNQDTLLVREQRQKWDAQGKLIERATRYRKQLDDRFRPDTAGLEHFVKNELQLNLSESEKKLMQKSLDSLIHREDSLYKIQPEWTGDTTNYKNQYDSQARLTRQEAYRHNQITNIFSFTYTLEATRVVSQSYNRNGDLSSETISLQHPTEHYILSDTSRSKNGSKWESMTYNSKDYPKLNYRYKYDDHGNWIEQKQVDINGKQIGVALLRKIEYYP